MRLFRPDRSARRDMACAPSLTVRRRPGKRRFVADGAGDPAHAVASCYFDSLFLRFDGRLAFARSFFRAEPLCIAT